MVSSKIKTFNGKKYKFRTDGRIFRQLSNGNWKETGKADNGDGYLRVMISGEKHYVHRIIWEVFNGPIPDGLEIDHINRDRTDNRLDNLRLVTSAQNNHNRKDNVMADELEAGMKRHSSEYNNAWAKKQGYKNFTEYQNTLAQKRGYRNHSHYAMVMRARRKTKRAISP